MRILSTVYKQKVFRLKKSICQKPPFLYSVYAGRLPAYTPYMQVDFLHILSKVLLTIGLYTPEL